MLPLVGLDRLHWRTHTRVTGEQPYELHEAAGGGGTQHFGGIYICRGQDPQFTSPQSFSSLSIQCQRVAQKLCYSFHIALLLGQV